MTKFRKISALLILILSILAFSGCNSAQKQNEDTDETAYQKSKELVEKQNKLEQLASDKFEIINDRVRELNTRIQEENIELTDHQEELLDKIQEMRVDVNNRLNNINNIREEDWEEIKANFENDIESIKKMLDEVLDEF